MSVVKVEGKPRDMPWGVMATSGSYSGMRIGEIWFDAGALLLKFLATADKLSVQVHPDDAYAAAHEAARGGRGKTEIWHVMKAQPGAKLALGFEKPMTREQIHSAALDGSLEHKLHWRDVAAGETYFVPAGTVHAIGAGLELCEVQQNCDLTYRLFDYGRARELHLDRGLDVIANDTGLAPGAGVVSLPFSGKYFQLSEVKDAGEVGPGHLIILDGEGKLGGASYASREVWKLDERVQFQPARETQSILVNPTR